MKRKAQPLAAPQSEDDDVVEVAPPPQSKKRKVAPKAGEPTPKSVVGQAKEPKKVVEKRLRVHRKQPPRDFWNGYARATSQRFYVLRRERTEANGCPGELVELTGSTGNVYQVKIEKKPSCNCPHGMKGAQCKHWLFVMKKVLNAPWDMVYQLALLSTELEEIFANAPPINGPATSKGSSSSKDGNRKPIEGDCPICYSDLDPSGEDVTFCRAACGQNMHRDCFNTWAQSKGNKEEATCPMCRSTWEDESAEEKIKRVNKAQGSTSEGYANVADQLGISQVRDTSTYHRWVGGSRGRGGWGGWGPKPRYRPRRG